MPFTTTEIQMLEDVRGKFQEASKKYGKKYFNMEKLEERIQHQSAMGGSFEKFLYGEIEFFKVAKAKAEADSETARKKEEFQRKLEEMVAENDKLISKYPDNFFDPLASAEIRKLVGAITNFFPPAEEISRLLFRGTPSWTKFLEILSDLERFYRPPDRIVSGFLKRYVDDLKSMGEPLRDDWDRKIMQTIAVLLRKLVRLTEEETALYTERENTRILKPAMSGNPTVTVSDAAKILVNEATDILENFRLTDLANAGIK